MLLLPKNIEPIPAFLLGGLRTIMLLEFYDFPYLTVDINSSKAAFLNYYIGGKENNTKRVLVEVSQGRLKEFLNKEISLAECFNNSESGFIYYGIFDKAGKPTELYLVNEDISTFNIPADYELYIDTEDNSSSDLLVKSIQANKILVEVYLTAPDLKGELKYWAIREYLVPFTELIRSAVFDLGFYNRDALDRNLGLSYSNLQAASLKATIEINYHKGEIGVPDVDSKNLEKLHGLFKILNANTVHEIITGFDLFRNKKIVRDYTSILKTIIKRNAVVKSQIAAPNEYYDTSIIDKGKAENVKRIIDEKIPVVEDVEEVRGILTLVDFDRPEPHFAMQGNDPDIHYKGKIDEKLFDKLKNDDFKFITKEYDFTILVVYTPPTSTADESLKATLLDIIDPEKVNQQNTDSTFEDKPN